MAKCERCGTPMLSDPPCSCMADDLMALPGYPWLPCPICHGVEMCDHVVPERARAALPGLILPPLHFLSERARNAPSEAQYRAQRLDDFRAYLSDFFIAWSAAYRAEEKMALEWERSAIERMNADGRRS